MKRFLRWWARISPESAYWRRDPETGRKCGYGQPQDCWPESHPECEEFNQECPD